MGDRMDRAMATRRSEVEVQYRFRGALRDGAATGGTFATDDLAAWVEARWHQRWRNLTILRGDEEVGGINRRDGSGPLIWWAEA